MQRLVDALVDEYTKVGTSNPGSGRLDEILAELRQLGAYMQALHCKDYAELSNGGAIKRDVGNLPVLSSQDAQVLVVG